jgi:hypothetical protein
MPDPTVPRCDCGWLENAAKDPDLPVVFDKRTGEFHIVRSGEPSGSYSVIYHCPFCGGSAPESKRDDLFEFITPAEMARLNQLTHGVLKVSEAIAKFGEPEDDLPAGHSETTCAGQGLPPRTEWFRTLRYTNLSDTAIVDIVVSASDGVHFVFMPKAKR